MKFQSFTPNILVENVDETVDFYKENFGFQLELSVPAKSGLQWAMLKRDEAVVMFQESKNFAAELPEFKDKPVGGALTFYLKMSGVNEFYEQIKQRVEIVKDLNTTFYGAKEFSVRDCNGFILTFASDAG